MFLDYTYHYLDPLLVYTVFKIERKCSIPNYTLKTHLGALRIVNWLKTPSLQKSCPGLLLSTNFGSWAPTVSPTGAAECATSTQFNISEHYKEC